MRPNLRQSLGSSNVKNCGTVKEFAVVYEHGPGNWSAYVPDLPGCVSLGDTLEETEKNIREAIELHVEVMQEHGDEIPEPTTVVSRVAVWAAEVGKGGVVHGHRAYFFINGQEQGSNTIVLEL